MLHIFLLNQYNTLLLFSSIVSVQRLQIDSIYLRFAIFSSECKSILYWCNLIKSRFIVAWVRNQFIDVSLELTKRSVSEL